MSKRMQLHATRLNVFNWMQQV